MTVFLLGLFCGACLGLGAVVFGGFIAFVLIPPHDEDADA